MEIYFVLVPRWSVETESSVGIRGLQLLWYLHILLFYNYYLNEMTCAEPVEQSKAHVLVSYTSIMFVYRGS